MTPYQKRSVNTLRRLGGWRTAYEIAKAMRVIRPGYAGGFAHSFNRLICTSSAVRCKLTCTKSGTLFEVYRARKSA